VSRKARDLPEKPDLTKNKVRVCGRRQEIPTIAQEQLLCFGLLVEERLTFVPTRTVWPNGEEAAAMVSGYVEENGMTGIIYGVPPTIIKNGAFDRKWVVRPIAAKYLDDKEDGIIMKLVSTDADSARGKGLLEESRRQHMPGQETTETTKTPEAPGGDLPGPDGMKLSAEEFLAEVSNGCIQCSRGIELEDADETMWVNNGVDPLCPRCVHDWQEEVKERGHAS
jgi:hypothetical protein